MIAPRRARSESIRTVTNESWQALVLDGGGPIVVEFMSYGCAHCRTIEPVIQEAASRLRETETFYRVNVAIESDLASRYDVEGTPTFVMFEHARELGRVAGPRPILASVMAAVTQPFAHESIST